jgi:hypothetical protein
MEPKLGLGAEFRVIAFVPPGIEPLPHWRHLT